MAVQGALATLGLRFLDASSRPVEPVPANWPQIETIEGHVDLPPVFIACDVTNPLLGPAGATATLGPQKGREPCFEVLGVIELSRTIGKPHVAPLSVDRTISICGGSPTLEKRVADLERRQGGRDNDNDCHEPQHGTTVSKLANRRYQNARISR